MIIWEKVSGGENGEGRSKKGGNNSNNNNNTNERYYYLASSSFPHLSQCSKLQNVFIITCSLSYHPQYRRAECNSFRAIRYDLIM